MRFSREKELFRVCSAFNHFGIILTVEDGIRSKKQYRNISCSVVYCVSRLIEEFMLLANMAVAHHIYNKYSRLAVLRRHPPPQTRMLDEMVRASQLSH